MLVLILAYYCHMHQDTKTFVLHVIQSNHGNRHPGWESQQLSRIRQLVSPTVETLTALYIESATEGK